MKYKKNTLSIIITSGSTNKAISSKFLKVGANDFLYKGFSNEEFFARLFNTLEVLELFQLSEDKANKDFLTGLYNRRYLYDIMTEIHLNAKIKNQSLCVGILDVDKFKNINDAYGHDIGDIALKEVSRILQKNLKENSYIARLGGEEFCIVLMGETSAESEEKLEIIRKEFMNNKIEINPNICIKYTVSIGATMDLQKNFSAMIKMADNNLYDAKLNGRNKVILR